jgi:hypothetical protein
MAQEGIPVVVQDFETWTRLGVKFEPNKVIDISLDQGLRLRHNSSELDEFFTNVKFTLNPIKNLSIGASYRFIGENDEADFELHQRFAFDAAYRYKRNRFSVEPRIRFQFKDELGVSKEEGDYSVKNLRFKLKFKYNIKNWKLDPIVSSEIFRQYEKKTLAHYDKLRFTIGTNCDFKRFNKIYIFYRMERELNSDYPKTTNVFGIQYRFIAKKFKK